LAGYPQLPARSFGGQALMLVGGPYGHEVLALDGVPSCSDRVRRREMSSIFDAIEEEYTMKPRIRRATYTKPRRMRAAKRMHARKCPPRFRTATSPYILATTFNTLITSHRNYKVSRHILSNNPQAREMIEIRKTLQVCGPLNGSEF